MINGKQLKKILVIEDEDRLRTILGYRLAHHGYNVIFAADGEQGLKCVRESEPDLVILDLMIPKIPGEEVCKELRRDERFSEIPIIMLTAKGTDTDRIVGRVIGANCYMVKPFDSQQLLFQIHSLLFTRH